MGTFFRQYLSTFVFLILFSTISTDMKAQVKTTSLLSNLVFTNNSQQNKVEVKLTPGTEIANLLVVIVDTDGKNMFLENQYHFKGTYSLEVSTLGFDKGEYRLKIIADNETEERIFRIK